MPTKLLPRKTEGHNLRNSHANSGTEQDQNRAEWRSLHKEEILEPDLPIIDSHHHLWDRFGTRREDNDCQGDPTDDDANQ